jgi:hypothetical protein
MRGRPPQTPLLLRGAILTYSDSANRWCLQARFARGVWIRKPRDSSSHGSHMAKRGQPCGLSVPQFCLVSRSLFIFITPIVLSLDLISWSYPFSGSRPFHGLLLITLISFTLFITCRSLSFTSVSPLFHLCFTFVSLWFHFHLWCPITFYAQPCTAVYSCAQPHLVVYIFSSLHWCTPVLTLSISWSVIDARPSLAYGFPTEYWPHLVIRSA